MVASQVKRTSAAPLVPSDINTSTKSVTYYVGSVNEEQSNYTEKYAAGSIVDYTTYFYDVSGINTRASLATANQKMTASHTSRLAMATSMRHVEHQVHNLLFGKHKRREVKLHREVRRHAGRRLHLLLLRLIK